MKRKVQVVKKTKKQIQKILFWLGGVFGITIILTLTCYHFAYWHKIYPGVTIAGEPVGNQTIAQALKTIESFFASYPTTLELKTDQQSWQINLSQLELSYNLSETAKKAYQIGRSGNLIDNFQTKIRSWQKGIDLTLDYSLNQNLLENQIATIASQIYIPAINPTIKINPTKNKEEKPSVIIEQGKDGQELDKRKLLSLIHSQLSSFNFNPIQVPLNHISPSLTEKQIQTTQKRAENFLGKKLVLLAEESKWELKDNDLLELLSFTNGFDQDKIASWSANLASAINHPPQDATFQFSEGKVSEFRPAKDGKTLDQKRTIDLIAQNLKKIEEGEKEITINLPLLTTPPAIKTADVNNLGIKELVGQGVSFFKGSIPNRIHNIQLASSRLNGLLIAPGEIFSFNQKLGEVSQLTGYKEAYIIKEGRTILGDGGGVCQTSTTLFRAALNAGLPIIERHPHAYRVSYYEQNSDPGFDATVFEPTADLKIKNDTPNYLLIQTYIDLKNQKLTYELYGTSDGRKVTISKARIWDQTPPPPDLYQDDPTLPLGTIKQVDWKAWGAKVAFDYKVERNGEILQNRTFFSNYRPWQAIYLRGTKQ